MLNDINYVLTWNCLNVYFVVSFVIENVLTLYAGVKRYLIFENGIFYWRMGQWGGGGSTLIFCIRRLGRCC